MLQDLFREPPKTSKVSLGRMRPFPLLSPKAILSPTIGKTPPPQIVTVTPGRPGHARVKSMQIFAPAVLGNRNEVKLVPVKPAHARHLSFGENAAAHTLLDTVSHHSLRGIVNGTFKSHNQDSMLVLPAFQDDPTAYFLALGDGHGGDGHKVSKYVTAQLLRRVRDVRGCSLLMKAIPDALRGIQKEVCMSEKFEAAFSGSTLVSIMFLGGTLLVVNVGDSRAVLLSQRDGRLIATALTTDHKPTLPSEWERITAHMGRVEPCYDSSGQPSGPPRVWLQDEDLPGLAMSRSVGDAVAHQAGVTEVPEVYLRPVQPADVAVILASDGLWDVLTNEEVAILVEDCLRKQEVRDCSVILAKAAEVRWRERSACMDDVSVIVGFFRVI